MSRAEPCSVPGCAEFKDIGKPFCRGHWRALSAFWRATLLRARSIMRAAKRDGDDERFVAAANQFEHCRTTATEIITNKENTHVAS